MSQPVRVYNAKLENPVVFIDMAAYEVNEVYLHIPAELSAANVELKIRGAIRLVDKVRQLIVQYYSYNVSNLRALYMGSLRAGERVCACV